MADSCPKCAQTSSNQASQLESSTPSSPRDAADASFYTPSSVSFAARSSPLLVQSMSPTCRSSFQSAAAQEGAKDMSACGSPAEMLVGTVHALQKKHARLLESYERLTAQHAQQQQHGAATRQELEFWRDEAARLLSLSHAKQEHVRRYAAALALSEPPADKGTHSHDAAHIRLLAAEKRLISAEAEISMLKEKVADAPRLHQLISSLEVEVHEERQRTKRAEASTTPLLVRLEESGKRCKDLRDQLGRSEMARQRQVSELQAELSNVSKRLRVSKSQSAELARKLQDTQPPPMPPRAPPAFQQRSVATNLTMFGDQLSNYPSLM